MRVIHKQFISELPAQVIELPKGAKILTAQYQNNSLCIWYECDPDADPENRTIAIFGTGWPMPDVSRVRYIATVQSGMFVWHCYEVLAS